MSLRPFFRSFWDEPWEGMSLPSRLQDQHFGDMILDDFFRPTYAVVVPRLQSAMQPPQQTGMSEVMNTDKEFRVSMDMQHFQPQEISIKTKDNRIIVNAKHEERPDEHGFISREFTRQYVLPKDVDPATVKCSLNKDGKLTMMAPKVALEAPKESTIPISMEAEEEK